MPACPTERRWVSLLGVWSTQTLRVLLIGTLIAVVVFAYWPRGTEATLADLIADLRAGAVTDLQIGSETSFGQPFVLPPFGHRYAEDTRVRWRTDVDGSWRTFRTSTQQVPPQQPADGTSIAIQGGTDPIRSIIAAELAQGPPQAAELRPLFGQWRPNLGIVAAFMWLLLLLVLLTGGQPRRATRWAWFWLLWMPFGLGMMALLLLEAPWSRRAARRPEPLPAGQQRRRPGGDSRLTGGGAFLIGFLAAVVIGTFANLTAWLPA